jgi:hypothetical protein
MKQSKFLSLGWRDFLRGLLMAVLTPVLTFIMNSLDHGEITLNWHLVYLSAVGGAVAYLLKNLGTKPDVKTFADINTPPPPPPPIIGGRPDER